MTITLTTAEELAALLGTLGDTADEVADKLRAADIKGCRAMAGTCPIASWLRKETGCAYVNVDIDNVVIRYENGPSLWADMPDPVVEFIKRFDNGVYLDLVANEATP